MLFRDRRDAGRRLAERLGYLRGADCVVLGLARGGVPVAFEVAKALGAPLDVIVVRKLGVPHLPELAMGAIGEDGVRVVNTDVMHEAYVTDTELADVEAAERVVLQRRVLRYRRGRHRTPVTGRTAVVVDDGIATGATASVACRVAHGQGATRVVLATPVASARAAAELARVADEVVCLATPELFYAIGEFYDDFSPTSDEQVIAVLAKADGLRPQLRQQSRADAESQVRRRRAVP